jgi:hypothetical protein
MFVVQGPAFLPWHRYFLWEFEQALRDISGRANLTIPYWDWANDATRLNVFTPALLGGNGTGPDSTVVDGTHKSLSTCFLLGFAFGVDVLCPPCVWQVRSPVGVRWT